MPPARATRAENHIAGLPTLAPGFLGLAKALIASSQRVYPYRGPADLKDRIKYILRGLARPASTRQWFQLLQNPELAIVVRNNPRITSKLQRPYLYSGLKMADRMQILREHYRFLTEYFSPTELERIYSKRGLVLAVLPHIGELGQFSVRLIFRRMCEKEGEITVFLMSDKTELPIMALSFTVTSFTEASREIFLGGLQAFKLSYQHDLVVAVTRGLHGLRPKALLLYTVQELARLWNIPSLRAVSNERCIYRDLRLRKKKVLVNYDEFWLESGGRLNDDGLFTLPAVFVPRPTETIKPNKRSLYKQRYAMLKNVSEQMERCLKIHPASQSPAGILNPLPSPATIAGNYSQIG